MNNKYIVAQSLRNFTFVGMIAMAVTDNKKNDIWKINNVTKMQLSTERNECNACISKIIYSINN